MTDRPTEDFVVPLFDGHIEAGIRVLTRPTRATMHDPGDAPEWEIVTLTVDGLPCAPDDYRSHIRRQHADTINDAAFAWCEDNEPDRDDDDEPVMRWGGL